MGKQGGPHFEGFKEFVDLDLSRQNITNLPDGIGTTVFPRMCNLAGTQVSCLVPLSRDPWLMRLNLWRCPVSDLSPISLCYRLEWLVLGRTSVSNVAPLTTLARLRYLDLSMTAVDDVSYLSRLTALEEVILDDTLCHDIRPILDLPNLRLLSIRNLDPVHPLVIKRNPTLIIIQ